MSIETISNAVCASSPRSSTAFEMRSGFSITSRWSFDEPIDVMIPSPTRAMIVSSVAPPISCARFVRTVTRARTFSSTPFLATALKRAAARFLGVGAVDHFGIDAGAHGVEHVAAGQVDRRGPVEVEIDVGPMRGDERVDHARHVAAGQVVGFEPARGDAGVRIGADARLHRHDLGLDDRAGVDLPQAHADQAQHAHMGIGHEGLQPELAVAEGHEGEHEQDDEPHQGRGSKQQRMRDGDGIAHDGFTWLS